MPTTRCGACRGEGRGKRARTAEEEARELLGEEKGEEEEKPDNEMAVVAEQPQQEQPQQGQQEQQQQQQQQQRDPAAASPAPASAPLRLQLKRAKVALRGARKDAKASVKAKAEEVADLENRFAAAVALELEQAIAAVVSEAKETLGEDLELDLPTGGEVGADEEEGGDDSETSHIDFEKVLWGWVLLVRRTVGRRSPQERLR